jgi:hypothetical protein
MVNLLPSILSFCPFPSFFSSHICSNQKTTDYFIQKIEIAYKFTNDQSVICPIVRLLMIFLFSDKNHFILPKLATIAMPPPTEQ